MTEDVERKVCIENQISINRQPVIGVSINRQSFIGWNSYYQLTTDIKDKIKAITEDVERKVGKEIISINRQSVIGLSINKQSFIGLNSYYNSPLI